jgi:antitoxin component YwqK of YwqJK toxin-antitoxin module
LNGKKNGQFKVFDEEGKISKEYDMKSDLIEGNYDEYYYDGGFIELSIGNIIELNASGFNVEISTYTISL